MSELSGKIRKIKLNDGRIFGIFDQGALRLDSSTNKITTGVGVVDDLITGTDLYIVEIDDVPLANVQMDVLIQTPVIRDENGAYVSGGELKRQDIRQVLKNLGLITAKVENEILDLAVVDFNGSI